MATRTKKDAAKAAEAEQAALKATAAARAYEAALEEYGAAVRLLHEGNYADAREAFLKVKADNPNEPELCERAATHALICERKLDPPEPAPSTHEDRYHRAVVLVNRGHGDDAIRLLNQVLVEDPTNASCLYVRASAWAMKGAAEKAVEDLRQAIVIDPAIRFQASNDPDFERIREEPSFIDIIEPTPTGV